MVLDSEQDYSRGTYYGVPAVHILICRPSRPPFCPAAYAAGPGLVPVDPAAAVAVGRAKTLDARSTGGRHLCDGRNGDWSFIPYQHLGYAGLPGYWVRDGFLYDLPPHI